MHSRNSSNNPYIGRMQASTAYPPQRRSPQPQTRWKYNDHLGIILHDPEGKSCQLCNNWLNHFISSVRKQDESLIAAQDAMTSSGAVQEDVAVAEREREEALGELADVRRKLDAARDNLRRARDMREEAKKGLRGESLDDLDGLVTRLCGDLKAAYRNAPFAAPRSGPSEPKASSSTMPYNVRKAK